MRRGSGVVGKSWREFSGLMRRQEAEGEAGQAQFKTRTRKTGECGTPSALCATRQA